MFAPRYVAEPSRPPVGPAWAMRHLRCGTVGLPSMKHKILIVDDDEAVRTGLTGVLLSEGYVVITARDGREAVERSRGEDVSLILVDINMPVLNGWGATGQLRSLKPQVPIILITARPDQQHIARAAGVELMEKPLEIPYLLARISELLQCPAET
jgi:two-component system OmpR family response regulator